jgi:hypothetical protein
VGPGTGNMPSFVEVVWVEVSVSPVGVLKRKVSASVFASGGQPLVPSSPEMDWFKVEKFIPLRRPGTMVRQALDFSKFESYSFDSLVKVKSLCPLGKKIPTAGYSARGEADVEGDALLQGDGVFGVFGQILELLGCFSKALVWRCGFLKRLGCKSLFGLKRRVGFVVGQMLYRYKAPFKGLRV